MFWILCVGLVLGILDGLMKVWANNQNKIKQDGQQNQEVKGFNSKRTGIIIIVVAIIVGGIFLYNLFSSGSNDFFSNNKKYEDIAKNYVEQSSGEYARYMTLVDTTSYSLDKEIRVTLKYRFTEGQYTSYKSYIVAVDKDTKKVVGLDSY